jgi:membrane associated rhomboid family serine protease
MITVLLIVITSIISILCFNQPALFGRLQFNAYQIVHRREYYRIISHGFVHANWWHLFVNMFVLFFFGRYVEFKLHALASQGLLRHPALIYLVLYLAAMIFASTISLVRYKDAPWYNSVGASGSVSAITFFFIFFEPWAMLRLYMAIPIPAIVFGVLYIIYSQYMSKRGGDNINHDAHLLGALFGFIFPLFIDLSLAKNFITQLLSIIR